MKIDFTDEFPESLNLPSNGITFSISGLFALISYGISIFGLNGVDIYKKVIICLCVTSLVLFIDLIIMFIRERELYYYSCFLKQYLDNTNKNFKKAEKEIAELTSRFEALNRK